MIGAGFAGASTAYHLARSGITDVLVLEREATYGVHASGRNAALCRQHTEDDVMTRLARRGAAFIRQPPEGFTSDRLLTPTGSVLLCRTESQLGLLMESAERHEIPCERAPMKWMLERESRLTGVPAIGGVYFPGDGVVDVHALLQGFVSGARSRGVRIELRTEVSQFTKSKTGMSVVLETNRGNVETACVVNAAGAWAGQLGVRAESTDSRFTPYLRHLFITERVSSLKTDLPFVWFLAGDDEFYLRPEGTGYLISGCDSTKSEPCDARSTTAAKDALVEKMNRLTPWIAELGIARSWACLRTFAPDGRPVIGWDRKIPWLFWVAGLGGHGATASPSIGRVAMSEIVRRLRG